MACGPIDYRRQQRERWIEMAYQITLSHRWAERIVDAIMESEHSAQLDHPDTKLSQEVERLKAENWEQGAEIERLKAELAAVRDDWFELGAKLVVSNLWRKEAEAKSREMGVDETHD